MKKIGRNAPCPCESGKKYKRCHGRPSFQETIGHVEEEARRQAGVFELQRERQQGKGRPIISTKDGDQLIVVVGRKLRRGPWILFTDFLHDNIKNTLGSAWGNAEMARLPEERHPVIQWYVALQLLQAQYYVGPAKEASSMPLYGVARAYLGLAYDLYMIEHNLSSTPEPAAWERLLHRLRHPDQFFGARYEVRVAAMFIRAGFVLEWEDETLGTTTHGEFTATFPATGANFWVECKMRQPSSTKEAGRGLGKFLALVVNALRKETDKQRLIFVDLNTPARLKPNKDSSDWRDWAVGRLRILEGSPEGRKLPAALIVVTNYPDHHHLSTLIPDAGGAIEGFKMDDYRTGARMSLHEAVERRERHPEMEALMKSMSEHHEIPSTFDGEIPELIGVDNRLLIGRKYEIEPGKIGTLMDACLMEAERKAAAIVQLEDGTQRVWHVPLSDNEIAAWRRYPETFLGELRPPNGSVNSVLDLYDFFLSSFEKTSRENLIAQLSAHANQADLRNLSHAALAKYLAEQTAENAARMSGGFPIPTWAARLRSPPQEK